MKKGTKQIIAVVILALLIGLSDNLFSQVYVALGAQNKGVTFGAGVLAGSIDINLSYSLPITSNENKKITSLSIGRQFRISDKFTVLPSAGYCSRKWTDFSKYDAGGWMEDKQEFKPVIGLQIGYEVLGKDAGNLYVYSSYCSDVIYGVGFRIYFSKL